MGVDGRGRVWRWARVRVPAARYQTLVPLMGECESITGCAASASLGRVTCVTAVSDNKS